MQHDPMTLVRFLFAYPVMLVCGIAWGLVFLRRIKLSSYQRYLGDYMIVALSFAAALTGAFGFAGLVYSKFHGFNLVSSSLFTIGIASMAVVLLVGALCMFQANWPNKKQ